MQRKNLGFLGYTDIQSAPAKSWICIWGSFEAGNVSRVSISISEVSAPYLVFACQKCEYLSRSRLTNHDWAAGTVSLNSNCTVRCQGGQRSHILIHILGCLSVAKVSRLDHGYNLWLVHFKDLPSKKIPCDLQKARYEISPSDPPRFPTVPCTDCSLEN